MDISSNKTGERKKKTFSKLEYFVGIEDRFGYFQKFFLIFSTIINFFSHLAE